MFSCAFCAFSGLTSDSKKRLAVFYRLAILNVDLDYFTTGLGLNLVHEFHGLDDAHDRLGSTLLLIFTKGSAAGDGER